MADEAVQEPIDEPEIKLMTDAQAYQLSFRLEEDWINPLQAVVDLSRHIYRRQSALNSIESRIDAGQTTCEGLEQTQLTLQQENARLTTENAALQEQQGALTSDVAHLEAESRRLEQTTQEQAEQLAKNEQSSATNIAAAEKASADGIAQREGDSQKTVNELVQQQDRLKAENAALEQRQQHLQAAVTELEADVQKHAQRFQDLASESPSATSQSAGEPGSV